MQPWQTAAGINPRVALPTHGLLNVSYFRVGQNFNSFPGTWTLGTLILGECLCFWTNGGTSFQKNPDVES